jgi:hypothetical protein
VAENDWVKERKNLIDRGQEKRHNKELPVLLGVSIKKFHRHPSGDCAGNVILDGRRQVPIQMAFRRYHRIECIRDSHRKPDGAGGSIRKTPATTECLGRPDRFRGRTNGPGR